MSDFDITTAKPYKTDEFDFSTAKLVNQLSWSDVATKAQSNLFKDSATVLNDVATGVLHPIDTAQGVLDMANGGLQKVLPESLVNVMHKLAPDTANNPQKFDALVNHYKTRYGSEEGFKQAIAQHPAETLMDISAFLTGGGSLAGKVPSLAKVGNAVAKAGDAVNPMRLAGRSAGLFNDTVSATVPAVLGATTGVGGDTIKAAFNAGLRGGDEQSRLLSAMRGHTDVDAPVESMRGALKNMRADASGQYQQGMEGLKTNTNPIDLAPIESAVNNALQAKKYGDFDLDPQLEPSRQNVAQALREFKSAMTSDPSLNTAYGLDKLKQRVGSIGEWEDPRSPQTMMVNGVNNAIKGEIGKQSPEYASIMSKYGDAANQADQIERTFSLGAGALDDTAARKALSLTRNDVSTNYGSRAKLAEKLRDYADEDFMPALHGLALNNVLPRGIMRTVAGAGVASGQVAANPAMALLASPRLVGEGSVKAGQLAKMLRKPVDMVSRFSDPAEGLLSNAKIQPSRLANALYQFQQANEQSAY